MEQLTEKQQKVLGFIEDRLSSSSPPSQREIAKYFGLAQNAVYQLIGYLKKKGYLESLGIHRGLRLSKAYVDKIRRFECIPLVGRVAAGEPILAEQNIEGYIDLTKLFNSSDDSFLLRVVGERKTKMKNRNNSQKNQKSVLRVLSSRENSPIHGKNN